ncbi:hypothetical protein HUF15_07195 [Streptomyces samsunensis]|uniref:Uncharacterized protein n=2 Tax=Streptomyces TaxID=1883 RepID=A0A291ST48_STRMQ|nr:MULTISPECIES: hypothetical protein [Streptomyces]AQA12757.1 hypothetical protein BV401_22245 [Streptomyces autolyticus]ATL84001.1 hypothetical protein SMALA_3768 [Streptomyces malaysiensis]AUA12739.1 hypothetical protein CFP59_04888 [Streptomyces sp. M56]MCC4320073.1 hypothetical protein [Streptomyces malaysiensis]MCD9594002.1 hypothetical protein [Streptomyces sp. 8ZJF_21]
MANNPQSPNGNNDPAGSTQMFRAFVDEGTRQPQTTAATSGGGPRVGVIVGVIAAVVIVAAVAWLALA